MAVIGAILPLFAIIAAGFLVARTHYFSVHHARAIGDLVMKIALPALIFLAVVSAKPEERLNPIILAGYAAGSLIVFCIVLGASVRILRLPVQRGAIVALACSSSNSGYLGYPVAYALLGNIASSMLTHCIIFENVVMLPLALLLSNPEEKKTSAQHLLRNLLLQLIRNPPLVAATCGLMVTGLGIAVPDTLMKAFSLVSQITGPAALLLVGVTLAALPIEKRDLAGAVTVSLVKLVGHPLSVFVIFALLPGLTEIQRACAVLFAAAPMLSILPIFGQRVGLASFSALTLLMAVVLCSLTIPVVFGLIAIR